MARTKSGERSELDRRIDELYELEPSKFVAARAALAKALLSEHERAAAAKVRDLPKPTASAWVVNQLWFKRRKQFEALLEAGDEMRDAQRRLIAGESASALRKAMQDEQRALSALLAEAHSLLKAGGLADTHTTLERAGTTLRAIARLPDASEHFSGRLSRDLELPGFGALVGLEPVSGRGGKPKGKAIQAEQREQRSQQKQAQKEAREREKAERRTAQAEARERAKAEKRRQALGKKLEQLEKQRRALERKLESI